MRTRSSLVTGGAQAAFALIARVLLRAGDGVVVEDPGYPNVRAVFEAAGAHVLGAGVDANGLDVSVLHDRVAKLVHVTPSHQYPLGAVLSLERRFALLDWAKRTSAWIVEDDYDSEFNYTGNPQPALYGLDAGRRVLYVGTFSKVLAPALRAAYVVVPRNLCEAFSNVQAIVGAQPSTLLQRALANFIASGQFGRHVGKMRRIYDERRCHASAELTRRFGAKIDVRDSRAGLHFVALLAPDVPDVDVSLEASRRGLIVPALSSYYLDRPPLQGLVIGYAGTAIDAATKAVATLADAYAAVEGSVDRLGARDLALPRRGVPR